MKVREVMTRKPHFVTPTHTIQQAAQTMAEIGAGVLPVGDNYRLMGMITDRDIAIYGVARGKGPNTPVGQVMTPEVKFCFEEDEVDEVTKRMGNLQLRRLPVLNRDKVLVGMISLGDIARNRDAAGRAGEALSEISRVGGEHSGP
jgi:CBS domain-containing protein